MASEKQLRANRANAQKSTGPKSKSGKKLSSMNALRHGLSVPLSTEGAGAQLKTLMRRFTRGAFDEESLALAERAAGAQLELARARSLEDATIERALTLLDGEPEGGDPDQRVSDAISSALPELARIQRYKKRALGRRDRALSNSLKNRGEENHSRSV